MRAIVGLYVSPPEHALVPSVDQKSQIQALDRTQPGLPMKRGRGATMTHDDKRHGTTTLFAALTRRRLKRGAFRSVSEPNQAIRDYLDAHNAAPRPFRWTTRADTIIGKYQRQKPRLESLHKGWGRCGEAPRADGRSPR